MHELVLIKKIVENAEAAAKKANINTVVTLNMRVGRMAGFEPEQLQFLFKTYEKSSSFSDTKLKVEEIPVELECTECRHVFIDERFDDFDFAHSVSHAPLAYTAPPCPKCGSNCPIIIRGRELELIDLEGE